MDRNLAYLWTDDPEYALRFVSGIKDVEPEIQQVPGQSDLGSYLQDLFGNKPFYRGRFEAPGWAGGCIVKDAPQSHFDLLIRQVREGRSLPAPLFCIAGSSECCHGQRNRPWCALDGNLHMAVLFKPNRDISHFGPGFLALAAVSVVETLDGVDGFRNRSGIKWVNDILIDGAKVAGFLVHTVGTESLVQAAVLGLGLNIETKPVFPPDPYVPRASSLSDLSLGSAGIARNDIVLPLLSQIHGNYGRLLDGKADGLIDAYRNRSVVIGKKCKVYDDPPPSGEGEEILASGLVDSIGPNLELFFRGRKQAITRGRLIILE